MSLCMCACMLVHVSVYVYARACMCLYVCVYASVLELINVELSFWLSLSSSLFFFQILLSFYSFVKQFI